MHFTIFKCFKTIAWKCWNKGGMQYLKIHKRIIQVYENPEYKHSLKIYAEAGILRLKTGCPTAMELSVALQFPYILWLQHIGFGAVDLAWQCCASSPPGQVIYCLIKDPFLTLIMHLFSHMWNWDTWIFDDAQYSEPERHTAHGPNTLSNRDLTCDPSYINTYETGESCHIKHLNIASKGSQSPYH